MVLMGEIFELIDFFSFTAWFFYGLTMLSLIVLRITQKERKRPYRVSIVVLSTFHGCGVGIGKNPSPEPLSALQGLPPTFFHHVYCETFLLAFLLA